MRTLLAFVTMLAAGVSPAAAAEGSPRSVTHIAAEQVTAGFARGAVLFDDGTNYMVHASRREAPGQAEVHTRDTDVIYVLDGAATFVTGGTVVEPTTTAPDEVRGREIRGGDTRRLAKGDVIIVPSGVPHWFKEVTPPVLYYVVKVR
jgi:quercetin dioxygenase-like cupin family protein